MVVAGNRDPDISCAVGRHDAAQSRTVDGHHAIWTQEPTSHGHQESSVAGLAALESESESHGTKKQRDAECNPRVKRCTPLALTSSHWPQAADEASSVQHCGRAVLNAAPEHGRPGCNYGWADPRLVGSVKVAPTGSRSTIKV